MAVTLTKLVASQHSLKYTYAADQGQFASTVTATQMIADCAAGPLKDLLNRANTGIAGVAWINLLSSKSISLIVTQTSTSGDNSAHVPFVAFSGPAPNVLGINTNSGNGSFNGTIELRYHPSQVR